jgi:hypothetical protein
MGLGDTEHAHKAGSSAQFSFGSHGKGTENMEQKHLF